MLKFDAYSFEKTAQAVLKFNDSARDHYATPEELQEFMRGIANQYFAYRDDSTFVGTMGFYLTAFPANDGGKRVVATVSASILV